jgi:hypothetical protein
VSENHGRKYRPNRLESWAHQEGRRAGYQYAKLGGSLDEDAKTEGHEKRMELANG